MKKIHKIMVDENDTVEIHFRNLHHGFKNNLQIDLTLDEELLEDAKNWKLEPYVNMHWSDEK